MGNTAQNNTKEVKSEKKKLTSYWDTEEVIYLKDHGEMKKGDKVKKHPNTAQMLRDHKIVK
ncbi:hypothetical protein [Spongiimicrobium salis]|uniref:hypothetical protein n=1 Tax=Spongiimicrobium salis TaxID=1667022 RepID=UPI00374CC57B